MHHYIFWLPYVKLCWKHSPPCEMKRKTWDILSISTLGKKIQQTTFWNIFIHFFPENKLETISIKCQNLFSGKIRKNVINLLSAELAQRLAKVRTNLQISPFFSKKTHWYYSYSFNKYRLRGYYSYSVNKYRLWGIFYLFLQMGDIILIPSINISCGDILLIPSKKI